ncbi:MAG: NlpC/P60 family protein [Parcubacteria group bacterium GW2011_GWF2_44_8b]|nr:MAG: NlpC/P60 family protein [Parcubacteria group bacterium GW2011_GWC1_43_30]KKT80682.1 MAG: NlpC/P60 family protein [Parcubacteria group bacterium GW2011_GWF2_44_8b]
MEYRAVGSRCAVILDSLHLPISREEALAILNHKGFVLVEVDIIALARQCIGTSQYRRGARPSEAPTVVDCSSFIKWLYAQRGIWLPRRSIQQRELGEVVNLDELVAGDAVFISGRIDYYHDDPANGVGHVGIATGYGTVVHAADRKVNVVESPLDKFVGEAKFRGARRYIPQNVEVLTFETPLNREVEVADDIKWIILQQLPG